MGKIYYIAMFVSYDYDYDGIRREDILYVSENLENCTKAIDIYKKKYSNHDLKTYQYDHKYSYSRGSVVYDLETKEESHFWIREKEDDLLKYENSMK